MVMSLRIIVSIAASFVIGIAFIAIVSTDAFAATAPAGTKRLHNNPSRHHGTIHHSGQVRHPRTPPATTMQR
jgi:hypothetical protein